MRGDELVHPPFFLGRQVAADDHEPSPRVIGIDREPAIVPASGAQPREHVLAPPDLAQHAVAERQDGCLRQPLPVAVRTLTTDLRDPVSRHLRRTLP